MYTTTVAKYGTIGGIFCQIKYTGYIMYRDSTPKLYKKKIARI